VFERNIIRSIAQSDLGAASAIARSVLSYHGENHPLPFYLGELNDPPVRYRGGNSQDEGREGSSTGSQRLIVSPIPASERIYVEWQISKEVLLAGIINVVDIHGKVLYHSTINPQIPLTVDISGFAKGLYVISVLDVNGGVEAIKFVKE
jgi:hypothetical protein